MLPLRKFIGRPFAISLPSAAMKQAFHVSQVSRVEAYAMLLGAAVMMTIGMGIRQNLGLFQDQGVRRLVDAGCGDLNWITHASEALELYLGFDVVPELVADAQRRIEARKTHFVKTADITRDLLPKADLILCRDVLTHLTTDGRCALAGGLSPVHLIRPIRRRCGNGPRQSPRMTTPMTMMTMTEENLGIQSEARPKNALCSQKKLGGKRHRSALKPP